jgi:ATP-dependent helicase/nuclease subunit A
LGLTQSQQAALALDKNISVTAGAGSGKTRILVDRFLKIAMGQPQLTRHIVAITFTEKAAGEMQERIALEVNARLSSSGIDASERKKLQHIRDQINSAHISTIHGFCMRILREFPIQAGVTPDFGILDPIRYQVLLAGAIKDIFKELDREALDDKENDWFLLFTSLSRSRVQEMLEAALRKPFESRQLMADFRDRSKAEYLDFLSEKWSAIIGTIIKHEDLQNAAMRVDEIINHDTLSVKNEKGEAAQKILQDFQKEFSANPDSLKCRAAFLTLAETFTTGKGDAYKNLSQIGKNESWAPGVRPFLLELSRFLEPLQKQIIKLKPGQAPGKTDALWYDLFSLFIKLYERVRAKFWEVKNEQGVLDFEDLQIFTLNLLRDNVEIREKLHQRFRYIMVDEFQDTNPVQWEIVELLATENDRLATDRVFVVGDPKQSIYGFREADIRIFKNVVQRFSDEADSQSADLYPGNIVFRESFRFVPQINAFINHFFGMILNDDGHNPFEVGYQNLTAQRNVPQTGAIELAVFDEADETLSEPEYMARKIKGLIENNASVYEWDGTEEKPRPMRFGDVAILIRDRSKLQNIEQAFRKNNVPFKTVGGVGFWKRQEIYDFYHILRFLANPTDDFAFVAMLRSRLLLLPDTTLFFFGELDGNFLERLKKLQGDPRLSQSDQKECRRVATLFDRWLGMRERVTLGELLHAITEDVHLFARLNSEFSGDQRTANLKKIIELADNFDQSGPGGLGAFLEMVDDLINREVNEGDALLALEDTGSVKIMTIHVSKGLQFPVVFTPFLNRSMRGSSTDVLLDRELGMGISFNGEEEDESLGDSTLFNLLRIRQKQKELAELKRIFYVAVSRASDGLYLSATVKNEKSKNDSMFQWLEECLVREGKSPYQPYLYKYDSFNLEIVNSYKGTDEETENAPGFTKMMDSLRVFKSGQTLNTLPIKVARPLKTSAQPRIFSATVLMIFKQDPQEYYRRYHLGYFEGDYKKIVIKKDDQKIDSLLKGKIVHRYLELHNPDEKNPQALMDKILFEYEIYDADTAALLTTEMENILARMQKSPIGQRILNAPQTQNELSLTMQLGDDFFTGTIDRLQKNGQGEWAVFDYKTNRISEAQLEEAGEAYKIQIESYALLLSRLYPGQTEYKVSLYFLVVDRLYEKVFSQKEVDEINTRFEEIIREIKQNFPIAG